MPGTKPHDLFIVSQYQAAIALLLPAVLGIIHPSVLLRGSDG
jgi:hypothetical protein